ncbi:MAG: translation initiation factor Sui1 [Spongiibacteraceae bacterium]
MTLVFSTDQGRHCPHCGQPKAGCTCNKKAGASSGGLKGDGVVRIQRQINGRGGKTVTVVSGLVMDETSLKTLAKDLKQRCGSGGAIKDGAIEIQGDHRETLRAELQQRGLTVKLSGG